MGIEPITYRLQGGCSTVELRRHVSMLKTRLFPSVRHYTKGIVASGTEACRERRVYQHINRESIVRDCSIGTAGLGGQKERYGAGHGGI